MLLKSLVAQAKGKHAQYTLQQKENNSTAY